MFKSFCCSSFMIVTSNYIDLLSMEYCILVVAREDGYIFYYVNNFAYCVNVN